MSDQEVSARISFHKDKVSKTSVVKGPTGITATAENICTPKLPINEDMDVDQAAAIIYIDKLADAIGYNKPNVNSNPQQEEYDDISSVKTGQFSMSIDESTISAAENHQEMTEEDYIKDLDNHLDNVGLINNPNKSENAYAEHFMLNPKFLPKENAIYANPAAQTRDKFCRTCGQKHLDSDNYCSNCGNKRI